MKSTFRIRYWAVAVTVTLAHWGAGLLGCAVPPTTESDAGKTAASKNGLPEADIPAPKNKPLKNRPTDTDLDEPANLGTQSAKPAKSTLRTDAPPTPAEQITLLRRHMTVIDERRAKLNELIRDRDGRMLLLAIEDMQEQLTRMQAVPVRERRLTALLGHWQQKLFTLLNAVRNTDWSQSELLGEEILVYGDACARLLKELEAQAAEPEPAEIKSADSPAKIRRPPPPPPPLPGPKSESKSKSEREAIPEPKSESTLEPKSDSPPEPKTER